MSKIFFHNSQLLQHHLLFLFRGSRSTPKSYPLLIPSVGFSTKPVLALRMVRLHLQAVEQTRDSGEEGAEEVAPLAMGLRRLLEELLPRLGGILLFSLGYS